jgi:uncharacterized membrane protein YbhN (UPF0104 family)
MTSTAGAAGPGRRPLAAIARGIAAGAVIAGAAAAVYAERGLLRSGMAALWHARPGWITAAIALECLSMAGFVLLQRRLFAAAGARPAFHALLATDYASNAIAVGLPIAGSGIAAASTVRRLRDRGIEPAAIELTLGLAGVLSAVGFAATVAAGALLTGNPAGAVTGLLVSCGSAVSAGVLVIVAHSASGRARLTPAAAAAVRLAQRAPAPAPSARPRSGSASSSRP